MLRYLQVFNGLGAFAGAVMAIAAVTQTTAPPAAEEGRTQSGNEARQVADSQLGRLDSETGSGFFRTSQIVGEDIYNLAGEEIGEVEDLVVDAKDGKVRYAAVTYGGFLGIGEKMFAVPWEAFRAKADPDEADELHLYLDVSQQTLEGMEGFDEDNWPNFADRTFTEDLDKRYKVQRSQQEREARIEAERARGVDSPSRR
jgi:sporulation protein YlmC with PRC-barrel domain